MNITGRTNVAVQLSQPTPGQAVPVGGVSSNGYSAPKPDMPLPVRYSPRSQLSRLLERFAAHTSREDAAREEGTDPETHLPKLHTRGGGQGRQGDNNRGGRQSAGRLKEYEAKARELERCCAHDAKGQDAYSAMVLAANMILMAATDIAKGDCSARMLCQTVDTVCTQLASAGLKMPADRGELRRLLMAATSSPPSRGSAASACPDVGLLVFPEIMRWTHGQGHINKALFSKLPVEALFSGDAIKAHGDTFSGSPP